MSKELLAALGKLEKDNDDHWTNSDAPAMEAVEKLMGDTAVTRKDVTALAPDFNRGNLTLPNVSDTQENESTELTESEKQIAEAEAALSTANEELLKAREKVLTCVKSLDALIVKDEMRVTKRSTASAIKMFQQSQLKQRGVQSASAKEIADLVLKKQQGIA